MNGVFWASYYQLLRFHAKKVIYLLVFSGMLFSFLCLFFTAFGLGPQEIIITDAALTIFGLFVFLFSSYLGISLVQEEIEKRNIYPYLVRVTPFQYLSGGILSAACYLFFGLALLYFELSFILFRISGIWPTFLFQNFLAQFSEGLLWMNFALLFSLFLTSNLSFSLLVGAYLVCRIPQGLLGHLSIQPVAWLFYFFKMFLPHVALFNLKDAALEKVQIPLVHLAGIVLYGLIYTAALILISRLVLKRKDL